jgi:hypothetical protein
MGTISPGKGKTQYMEREVDMVASKSMHEIHTMVAAGHNSDTWRYIAEMLDALIPTDTWV